MNSKLYLECLKAHLPKEYASLIVKTKAAFNLATDEEAYDKAVELCTKVFEEEKAEEMKAAGEFYMSLEELKVHSPGMAKFHELMGLNHGDSFVSIIDNKNYRIVQAPDEEDTRFIVKIEED